MNDREPVDVGPVLPRALTRVVVVGRLLALDARGELTSAHVRLAAAAVGAGERTVRRWLADARTHGGAPPDIAPRRFQVTDEVRRRLALWGGNAAAAHRDWAAEAAADPAVPAPPSLRTFQRAVRVGLTAGERAGLRGGEKARRAHDVFGRRPPQWRNACWEGDHKHVPVDVDLDGRTVRPWVTWFTDCATKAIVGTAVTPHAPSRDAVLAALRTALSRDEPGGPYGPIGGLPERVRVDRGKEFLCRTVTTALGAFAVPVQDLPPCTAHLKGTVEALNNAVEEMLLVSLPGFLHRAQPDLPARRRPEDLLPFEVFVRTLLDWVAWWNTAHRPTGLRDALTPLQAWNADPTPVEDVPAGHLALFALEDDGRVRVITTSGVTWRRRAYVAPWMVGRTGTRVRLRRLPHHTHEIEVFDARDATRHLGTAYLADEATPDQRTALRAERDKRARKLKADLRAAEKLRRERYAAVTTPTRPQRLGEVTEAEADAELARARQVDLTARALPDLIPPREPPPSWARPVTRGTAAPKTTAPPAPDEDTDSPPPPRG